MTKTIKFTHKSIIKTLPIGSENLPDNGKFEVSAGEEIPIDDATPDKNQHMLLALANPIKFDAATEKSEVFVYRPHITMPGDEKIADGQYDSPLTTIRLPVVYRSQLDNVMFGTRPGSVQCNLTCCTMLTDFLLDKFGVHSLADLAEQSGFDRAEPETFYGETLSRFGDTTDHTAQTEALRQFGIESYFSYSLSIAELRRILITNQIPVVLGVAYGGAGHMILAVGTTPDGILVHDPYGVRAGTGGYDNTIPGDYDFYSHDILQQIWVDLGADAGWGRPVTAVNQTETGVPGGL